MNSRWGDKRLIRIMKAGGNEEFGMFEGKLENYRRTLGLKSGLLTRELTWTSPGGKKIHLKVTRLISFKNKHIAAIRYKVVPLNFNGNIKIISALDGDVVNSTTECNSRIDYGPYGRALLTEDKFVDKKFAVLIQKTRNTKLKLVCAMENNLSTDCCFESNNITDEFSVGIEYDVNS